MNLMFHRGRIPRAALLVLLLIVATLPTTRLAAQDAADNLDRLTADEQALLEQLQQRYIDACNRHNDRDLAERRIAYRDSACPISGATRSGLRLLDHAVELTISWDKLEPAAIAASYADMTGLTAADWHAIAVYCVLHNVRTFAEHAAVEALHEDGTRKAAIDWLIARMRGESAPAEGYVAIRRPNRLGRFVSPAEAEAIRYEMAVAEAMTALETVDADSTEGQEAIRNAARTLNEKPELAKQAIRAQHDELVKQIEDSLGENEKLDRAKEKLEEARASALEVIFDKRIYPDENHGRVGQPKVDREVDKVRRIWESRVTGNKVPAETATLADRLRKIVMIGQELGVLGDDEARAADNTARWIAVVAGKKLDIQNYSKDNEERGRIADHHQVANDNTNGNSNASGEERAHATIVNEYRHMMGRHPLRLNPKLVNSARRHAEYMKGSGKFAHVIAGHPDGAQPIDRMRKAGYEHEGSENIAYASRGHSAGSSFNGWYNSSGHHRNMLSPGWRVFGVGAAGTHWTQNFGAKDDGSEPRAGR